MLLSLWNELNLAARRLLRRPSYAITAIVTLALGVGANAAVFSVVRGVLGRPLPYPQADRIVLLSSQSAVSIPDGRDWRKQSRTLDGVALFLRKWDFDLVGQGEPLRLSGSVVEPEFFHILGVHPVLGRVLEATDDEPTAPGVAVISVGLWHRVFGGDPDAIGQTVTLNDHPTTIVGVMPASADVLGDDVELWTPVATQTPWALAQRGTNNFDALGLLRPGVRLDDARKELKSISDALTAAYPQSNSGKVAVPVPLLTGLVGDVRTPLLVLEGAVVLVLLLATANLTGLVLARGGVQHPEVVVRAALGASRRALVTLFLAEGAVLTLVGGGLGIVLALAGEHALIGLLPSTLPRVGDIRIDMSVVALAAALALASGLVLTVVPAIQELASGETKAPTSLRTSPSKEHDRLLGALVMIEVALAVVVLSGSALLGRTFVALERVHLGFDPDSVVTSELVLPEARYSDIPGQTRAIRGVVERIAAAPEVEAAGSVIGLPLGTSSIGHRVLIEGRPAAAPGEEPRADSRPVVGDYFAALRIPIVSGRGLTAADNEHAVPVAIVNQALARQLWPTTSPIGARLKWVGADSARSMTVVGVAGDTRSHGLTEADVPAVYTPYVQRTEAWQRWSSLVVRSQAPRTDIERVMRAAVAAVDPLVPIGRVTSMGALRSAATSQQRVDAIVLAAFAAAALLIAVQGIYGTMAYVVEQRRREIGIRIAVGATSSQVRHTVVVRGMRATTIGVAVGLIGAMLAGRAARSALFGISSADPSTYIAVALVIAAAAWCGALVPAIRASRVDAATVLRGE